MTRLFLEAVIGGYWKDARYLGATLCPPPLLRAANVLALIATVVILAAWGV